MTIHPHRDVRLVDLSAPDATRHIRHRSGTADAVPAKGFQLLFHAPPAGGVTVHRQLAGTGPVTFRVLDGGGGLSNLSEFIPRPPDVGVQGSHTSELVLVGVTVTV